MNRICKIIDCNDKYRSIGYCNRHYTRLRMHGDISYVDPHFTHSKNYSGRKPISVNREQTKEWIKNNIEHIKKYRRDYYKKNTSEILGYMRKRLEKLGNDLNMDSFQVSMALRAWARIIKSRDNQCKICSHKENLIAHHILYKNKYPESFLEVYNGVTLCKDCHYDYHKLNGWK